MERLVDIALWVVPILLAVILHEVAHGWVAHRLGDPTAAERGRLTLNPIAHVDLLGTIIVPLLLVLSKTGFVFGWAKPVPINYANLRHPRRDMMLVAAAGPVTNLLIAAFAALVVHAMTALLPQATGGLPRAAVVAVAVMATYTVTTNVFLGIFNLLPIPPLDGGRVMTSLLPRPLARGYARVEPFGFVIVFALLASDALGPIVGAPAELILRLLLG